MEVPVIKINMFVMMGIVVAVIYFGQWLRNKLPVLKKYITLKKKELSSNY